MKTVAFYKLTGQSVAESIRIPDRLFQSGTGRLRIILDAAGITSPGEQVMERDYITLEQFDRILGPENTAVHIIVRDAAALKTIPAELQTRKSMRADGMAIDTFITIHDLSDMALTHIDPY